MDNVISLLNNWALSNTCHNLICKLSQKVIKAWGFYESVQEIAVANVLHHDEAQSRQIKQRFH